jgi:hypothetical protein
MAAETFVREDGTDVAVKLDFLRDCCAETGSQTCKKEWD